MFCDETTVKLIAGKGGNGCIAFRREKFTPRGGPYGGDGGKGGSVFLEADENINTLAEFNTKKLFRGNDAENGLGKQMGGKDAEDIILHVPVGTLVFDEKKEYLLADLQKHGERFCAARGGRGGFGNAHFKNSIRQAPRFAELGEPGTELTVILELKLVADVGLIGFPSVGKSTMLSRISNARPKIAEYHFTTIIPNLGLVTLKPFGGSESQNFLACDLPGLIEGAHAGKGLGIQFLKHIVRNRVLVHLIDVNALDIIQDYKTINAELKTYDKKLAKKPQIVVFNKIDSIDAETLKLTIRAFKKKFPKIKDVFGVSCVTGEGLKPLMFRVFEVLQTEKKEVEATPVAELKKYKIWKPAEDRGGKAFTLKVIKKGGPKSEGVFEVSGQRINQIVVMTDFTNPEAVARVYDVFEKMGIDKRLHQNGARYGDKIIIGKQTILYRWE